MVQIANPIYDSVFKYMMQNQKVCMILLGALLNRDIVDVKIINNELIRADLKKFAVLRLDFLAKIKNPDGSYEMVSIELQKAEKSTEIVRFRRYLARLYDTEANQTETIATKNRKGKLVQVQKETPIHIVAIYILGHSLDGVDEPVIYYSPQATNASGEIIKNVGLIPFFRYLSHDSIVVQIPYLRKNARTRVEEFLEIFDQSNVMPDNEHFLLLDNFDNKPEGYNLVVRQLASAAADKQVKTTMMFEDEFAEDLENWTELEEIVEEQKEKLAQQKEIVEDQKAKLAQQKELVEDQKAKLSQQSEQLSQQSEQIVQQSEQLAQQSEQIAQQSEQLSQQSEQIAQQKEQLAAFAKILYSMGLSREDISAKINIPLEQLGKLLES